MSGGDGAPFNASFMQRSSNGLAILLIVMVGVSIPARAWGQAGSIRGTAYDAFDSQPMPGVDVVAFSDDEMVGYAISDGSGRFEITGVPMGALRIETRFVCYERESTELFLNGPTAEIDVPVGRVLSDDELAFTSRDAERDLSEGRVQILGIGTEILPGRRERRALRSLDRKYGFSSKNLGCDCSPSNWQGVRVYNAAVRAHLDERNGPDWWERYLQERKTILTRSH